MIGRFNGIYREMQFARPASFKCNSQAILTSDFIVTKDEENSEFGPESPDPSAVGLRDCFAFIDSSEKFKEEFTQVKRFPNPDGVWGT